MENKITLIPEDFSPKQVAQALGVSESSLKRWCDRGLLSMHRTAGGHRRLRLVDVLQFVRTTEQRLVSPELIGLTGRSNDEGVSVERSKQRVIDALINGDQETAVAIGVTLYGQSCPLITIIEEVYTPALREIGERWAAHTLEIFEERRSVVIVMQFLAVLSRLLSEPDADAFLALGATCEGDFFTVPMTMGEMVLREAGWNAQSMGSNIPVSSIIEAVISKQPKLVWLSLSEIPDLDALSVRMTELAACAAQHGTCVVVGGRALNETVRKRLQYTAFCEDFYHLVPLANSLRSRV